MSKIVLFLLRTTFNLTKKEINGFVVVSIFFIAYLVFFIGLKVYKSQKTFYIDEMESQKLEKLLKKMDSLNRNKNQVAYSFTFFDPNTIDKETWEAMGVKEHVAQRIIKYVHRGGVFLNKEDILKIYDFPEDIYKAIYPYIHLPTKNAEEEMAYRSGMRKSKSLKQIKPFEINTASIRQLTQVKGIGKISAKRIVDFRDQLGGFYRKAQFDEVYRLSSRASKSLKEYTTLDSALIKPIQINKATSVQLSQHPYIDIALAKAIINHRQRYGIYRHFSDLYSIHNLDTTILLERLRTYIAF